jgi:glycosyltransferase involved in cell wall biosynthesis
MDGNIQFSVVIPFRNRQRFLPSLVLSIEQIADESLEIIFVDNHSTDHSRTYLDHYIQQYTGPHQYKIVDENRIGASVARNTGASHAKGEYLYFFDSDDELSPAFFKEVKKALPADIIAAPTCLYFNDGTHKVRDVDYSAKPEMQILLGMLSTQSMVIKKTFFEATDGWNVRFKRWNDYELGTRLLLNKPTVKWLKQPFHKINVHNDSITGANFSSDIETLTSVLEHIRNLISLSDESKRNKQKCVDALFGKYEILRLQLIREGNQELAHSLKTTTNTLQLSKGLRRLKPILFFLTEHRIPLSWRIVERYLKITQ